MKTENGKSFRFAWVFPLLLSLIGIVFGAGGATMVTRANVARHEKCIEKLTEQNQETKEALIRIDTRLSHIEQDFRELKEWVKSL